MPIATVVVDGRHGQELGPTKRTRRTRNETRGGEAVAFGVWLGLRSSRPRRRSHTAVQTPGAYNLHGLPCHVRRAANRTWTAPHGGVHESEVSKAARRRRYCGRRRACAGEGGRHLASRPPARPQGTSKGLPTGQGANERPGAGGWALRVTSNACECLRIEGAGWMAAKRPASDEGRVERWRRRLRPMGLVRRVAGRPPRPGIDWREGLQAARGVRCAARGDGMKRGSESPREAVGDGLQRMKDADDASGTGDRYLDEGSRYVPTQYVFFAKGRKERRGRSTSYNAPAVTTQNHHQQHGPLKDRVISCTQVPCTRPNSIRPERRASRDARGAGRRQLLHAIRR